MKICKNNWIWLVVIWMRKLMKLQSWRKTRWRVREETLKDTKNLKRSKNVIPRRTHARKMKTNRVKKNGQWSSTFIKQYYKISLNKFEFSTIILNSYYFGVLGHQKVLHSSKSSRSSLVLKWEFLRRWRHHQVRQVRQVRHAIFMANFWNLKSRTDQKHLKVFIIWSVLNSQEMCKLKPNKKVLHSSKSSRSSIGVNWESWEDDVI